MYAMYGQSIKNFVFDALPSKKAIDQSPPYIAKGDVKIDALKTCGF